MSVALGMADLPPHVLELIDATNLRAYAAGLADGRAQAEADMAAAWAPITAHVRDLGSPRNHTAAQLADARGQRERAAAIRADHAARGVAA